VAMEQLLFETNYHNEFPETTKKAVFDNSVCFSLTFIIS